MTAFHDVLFPLPRMKEQTSLPRVQNQVAAAPDAAAVAVAVVAAAEDVQRCRREHVMEEAVVAAEVFETVVAVELLVVATRE